jgi:hypothetical protein
MILDNLKKLCCSDGVATKQTVQTILSVVSVPSELSLDAQVAKVLLNKILTIF